MESFVAGEVVSYGFTLNHELAQHIWVSKKVPNKSLLQKHSLCKPALALDWLAGSSSDLAKVSSSAAQGIYGSKLRKRSHLIYLHLGEMQV